MIIATDSTHACAQVDIQPGSMHDQLTSTLVTVGYGMSQTDAGRNDNSRVVHHNVPRYSVSVVMKQISSRNPQFKHARQWNQGQMLNRLFLSFHVLQFPEPAAGSSAALLTDWAFAY